MPRLRAGAATSDITPPLGTFLAGYYHARQAVDVHDGLCARALCLSADDGEVAIVSCDLIGLPRESVQAIKQRIRDLCGLAPELVLVGCTHTHTGPETRSMALSPTDDAYLELVNRRIADAVVMAHRRLAPAGMAVGLGQEADVSFNRRFWMRDSSGSGRPGKVRTNPGIGNPDIVRPAGPIDPAVGVLALRSLEGRLLAIWVNFAVHLDTTGGDSVSADYPYYLTRALRQRYGQDVVVLFNPGAMGDLNHFDVRATGAELKGESHPSRIGNALAGVAQQVLAKATFADVPSVAASLRPVRLPLRAVTPERVAAAEKVIAESNIGKADFTMELVAAHRDRKLAEMPDAIETEVQALRIGDVGIVGMPGEVFVELGMALKQRSPLQPTFVAELANDSIGYIPTAKAYDEGGYEPTSTVLAPGVGEALVEEGLKALAAVGRG
ncbi:MAG: hypothetical protein ACYC5O_11685 [Anaerolineae bacterium]